MTTAMRLLCMNDIVEEETFAKVVTQFYKTVFRGARWSSKGGYAFTNLWTCTVKRFTLLSNLTEQQILQEHAALFDAENRLQITAKVGGTEVTKETPFTLCPPKMTVASLIEYIDSWNKIKATMTQWLAKPAAADELNSFYGSVSSTQPTAADELNSFYGSTPSAQHMAKTLQSAARILSLWVDQPESYNILFPCELTPFIVPAIFPEVGVAVAKGNVTGTVPYYSKDDIANMLFRTKPVYMVKPEEPSKVFVEVEIDIALKSLAKVFEGEYVQKTNDPEYAELGIPRNVHQAMWKIFALNPSLSKLSELPIYKDTYVGGKPLPTGWNTEKVIEFYYKQMVKDESEPMIKKGHKVTLSLVGEFSHLVHKYYNLPYPFRCHDPALVGYDMTPIVETIVDPASMSEGAKKGWLNVFVREMIVRDDEKAVLGSSDTHLAFLKWATIQPWCMGYSTVAAQKNKEAFKAQFSIGEFTRLMKAIGFEMTRRSRGMVYLGAALKPNASWAEDTPKEPEAEGETIYATDGGGNTITVTLEANTTKEEFYALSSLKPAPAPEPKPPVAPELPGFSAEQALAGLEDGYAPIRLLSSTMIPLHTVEEYNAKFAELVKQRAS